MLCPHCSRPVSTAAANCPHCGRKAKTARQRDQVPISCPQCIAVAGVVNCGPMELDICERCSGTWFDRSELDAFVKAVDDPSSGGECRAAIRMAVSGGAVVHARTYFACPICKRTLTRRVHAQVTGAIAHICNEHGAWVAKQDLLRVLAAVEDYGAAGLAERAVDAAARQRSSEIEAALSAQRAQLDQIAIRMQLLWGNWFL
jgi:Zn-finger nucleic acid-binding protein